MILYACHIDVTSSCHPTTTIERNQASVRLYVLFTRMHIIDWFVISLKSLSPVSGLDGTAIARTAACLLRKLTKYFIDNGLSHPVVYFWTYITVIIQDVNKKRWLSCARCVKHATAALARHDSWIIERHGFCRQISGQTTLHAYLIQIHVKIHRRQRRERDPKISFRSVCFWYYKKNAWSTQPGNVTSLSGFLIFFCKICAPLQFYCSYLSSERLLLLYLARCL